MQKKHGKTFTFLKDDNDSDDDDDDDDIDSDDDEDESSDENNEKRQRRLARILAEMGSVLTRPDKSN